MKHSEAVLDGVSRETRDKLQAYMALLLRWNTHINLVARRPDADLWQRHFVDSLQLLPVLPGTNGPLVDLGSGAGFPGLVLAVATGRKTHLIEADRRKCAFLQEVARVLSLPHVIIHPERIEAANPPRAAIVSARALAPLTDLLHHAHRILAHDGVAIFPKGRAVENELTAASVNWTMRTERLPSCTDPASTILRLSEICPVGAHA